MLKAILSQSADWTAFLYLSGLEAHLLVRARARRHACLSFLALPKGFHKSVLSSFATIEARSSQSLTSKKPALFPTTELPNEDGHHAAFKTMIASYTLRMPRIHVLIDH